MLIFPNSLGYNSYIFVNVFVNPTTHKPKVKAIKTDDPIMAIIRNTLSAFAIPFAVFCNFYR